MIPIKLVTIKNLTNGKLIEAIPEFYELEEIVENNDWHINQSVFKHTLSVLKNLNNLFRKYTFEFGKPLNAKISKYSRKQLLFIAALLHDIAKKETIKNHKRFTECPHHEAKGAVKARKILMRFDLSQKEKDFVIKIIRKHGLTHKLPVSNGKYFAAFKKRNEDIFLELILLAIADMQGTMLKIRSPDDFKKRFEFYEKYGLKL